MSAPPPMSKNLSYFLQRIMGVSTNAFRLSPQNSDSATANGTIRFSLPSNTLWNVKATTLLFNASCFGVSGDDAGARLPPAECLVDRYEVSAGGILIAQGHTMYNVLTQAKGVLSKRHVDPVLGHPEYVLKTSYVNGKGTVDAADEADELSAKLNEGYPSGNGQTQFGINTWEGFLGSCSVGLLDTALLPDLVLTIFLASDNVISSVTSATVPAVGAGGARYQLKNIRLLVEAVSLGSSVYDELVARRIAQTGFVEIFYKTYQSFIDTHTGSSKFQISTQSLDRVWVVHRAAGYDTQGGLAKVASSEGSMGTAHSLYRGSMFNFALTPADDTVPCTHHLLINGSMTPNFTATSTEMYALSRAAVESPLSYPEHRPTLEQFHANNFVLCWRFNLPGSEKESILSGIDARSLSLQCDYRTTGVKAGDNVVIFTENSSSLRIGSNRSVEYIA